MGTVVTRIALTALVLTGAPAFAWTAEMRVRMTDEAVRFMPPSLRLALESHRDALLRGMLTPLTVVDDPDRRPPWSGGTLDVAVEREVRALEALLARPSSFDEVARGFGGIAHLLFEASFPPGMSEPFPRERAEHFSSFCAQRLEKFPLVFLGHEDDALDAGEFRVFALRAMEQARDEDANLARAYEAAGRPPDPSHFGDRSVPFAVASLSYSRAVNHVVRVWLALWKEAGGDMGRTPYLTPRSTTEPQEANEDG